MSFATSPRLLPWGFIPIKKNTTVETLSGTLQQVLFSPKGVIEGLLLTVRGALYDHSLTATVLVAALAQLVGLVPIGIAAKGLRIHVSGP